MKVLWFTGSQPPAVTGKPTVGLAWQERLRQALEEYHPEIELAIASIGSKDYAPFRQGNASYYNILRTPTPDLGVYRNVLNNWRHYRYNYDEIERYLEIVREVSPDVVMYYGGENPFALISGKLECPSILNIQGLITAVAKHYFDGITRPELLSLLFSRDFLRGTGMIHRWWYINGYLKIERKVYRACNVFTGRTAWDRELIEKLHPGARYYHCDEILAKPFYPEVWNPEHVSKDLIFTTSSNALFKGPVSLVRGVAELKKRGRKIGLRIAGTDSSSEAGRFIRKIIQENQLEGQIELLGRIPHENIIEEMKKATLFVLPTHMDVGSQSLCEAMMLGMPCIGSNAGGITTTILDGVNGLIYPHKDISALADTVEQLLDHPDQAEKLGLAARETALKRHDPRTVSDRMAEIYQDLLSNPFPRY